jgi:hypothetical protein
MSIYVYIHTGKNTSIHSLIVSDFTAGIDDTIKEKIIKNNDNNNDTNDNKNMLDNDNNNDNNNNNNDNINSIKDNDNGNNEIKVKNHDIKLPNSIPHDYQNSSLGHDSVEDASTAMRLANLKVPYIYIYLYICMYIYIWI